MASFSLFFLGLFLGISILYAQASEIPDQSPVGGTVIPNFQELLVGSATEYIDAPNDKSVIEVGGAIQGIFVSGKETGIEALSNLQGISATTSLPRGRGQGMGVFGNVKVFDNADTGFGVKGQMSGAYGYGLSGDQFSTPSAGGAGVHGYSADSGSQDKAVSGYLARRETNGDRASVWGMIDFLGGQDISGGIGVLKSGNSYGLFTDFDAKVGGSLITDRIWSKTPGSSLSLTSDGGNVVINDTLEINGSTTFNGQTFFQSPLNVNAPLLISSSNLMIDGNNLQDYVIDLIRRNR